jgi:hypothetical protein
MKKLVLIVLLVVVVCSYPELDVRALGDLRIESFMLFCTERAKRS